MTFIFKPTFIAAAVLVSLVYFGADSIKAKFNGDNGRLAQIIEQNHKYL
ncbi:MAG: hypothetical protein IE914_06095 [Thiotrichales bacterium]|nr:hypothetical protein [Thiotrichales bacterium]